MLGEGMKQTKKILPNRVPDRASEEMDTNWFTNYPGAILSGIGGVYVIAASETEIFMSNEN